MVSTKAELIYETFNVLYHNKVDFLTLRNFDLIPDGCSIESDIDTLVRPGMLEKLATLMHKLGFEHSTDIHLGLKYLYGAETHHHFKNKSMDIQFDVVTGLYYRSMDEGQYVPVCRHLQDRIFAHKLKVRECWIYQPASEDELTHICCHSIFDKRKISKRYIERMLYLFDKCNSQVMLDCLRMVFYEFAPVIMQRLKEEKMQSLLEEYVRFIAY